MKLTPGQRIGNLEIIGALGEGGMGEVYRATDTKLKRQVALKTLPPVFAADQNRVARFQREAEVLATLNHPHIAAIYGLEEYDGVSALVMELVEGEDLSQRIARGPIPLDEALPIARQIAEALEAAHEQGIVHRDLKPANIKVRADGVVKVLDFGLAKALESSPAGAAVASMSPTVSLHATMAGVVLGTAAYMSPEQARGRPVDKRSDIWAFGAVLYEMLTGTRAFKGEDITDLIAAVVKDTPNWAALPGDLPPTIVTLIQRCLDKDRKTRIGDIAVARFLLSDQVSAASVAAPSMTGDAPRARGARTRLMRVLPWAVAVVMAALAAALYVRLSSVEPPEVVRFEVPLVDQAFEGSIRLSPDGRRIAFTGAGGGDARRVWVRSLDALEAQPLKGTEGAYNGVIWLPDNRTLVFASSGKLRKISADGGPAQQICDVSSNIGGGFLTADNRIVFGTPGSGLRACPAGGGAVTSISALKADGSENFHNFPFLLPDGKHFLFYRGGREAGVYLGSLDAKPEDQTVRRLLPDPSAAEYVPGVDGGRGHVLFVRDTTLMAQPFDAASLSLVGDPVPVSEVRAQYGFSTSRTGRLAYFSGSAATQLTWLDRGGRFVGTVGRPGRPLGAMRISPDGTRVAGSRTIDGNSDIWIIDVTQGGAETKFTTDPARDTYPVWSPDSTQIVFLSERTGIENLYLRAADGTGADVHLFETVERAYPGDWSRDGKWLLFSTFSANGFDLWVLPMTGAERKPIRFLRNSSANEASPRFSPDGRFVAYVSDESGTYELYVKPFDPAAPEASVNGGGIKVSRNGIVWSSGIGEGPRWERDAKGVVKGLIYFSSDRKRWLTDITTVPVFRVLDRHLLGEFLPGASWLASTPDNQQVLAAAPTVNQQPSATVVLNWQAGLKK